MEIALKNSLLLTHGTIYGDVATAAPWADADKSVNIDKWGSTDFWLIGIPHTASPQTCLSGAMTNNAPIDFYHWNIAGHRGESGLEWWKKGISLLMRHV